MEILFYITLLFIWASILKACWAIRSIRRSFQFFEMTTPVICQNPPNVVIVLSVLREQKVLKDTVEHMFKLEYPKIKLHLLLVSTEREHSEQNPSACKVNTIEVIKKLQKQHPTIKWLHYPDSNGIKADQMNYAIDQFENIFPELSPEHTFYAFYDADSRPASNVLNIFSTSRQHNGNAHVFQQSATYLKNFDLFSKKKGWSRFFLKAQALKQTRFIFAYEIPRIRRVFQYCSGKHYSWLGGITYAPCIAHGLFVRVAFLKKIPFPKNYTPEDMYWGYLVSCHKESIVPLPSLDSSETPDSVKQIFLQLARWFRGPFFSYKYLRCLQKDYRSTYHRSRVRSHLITLFALFDGLNWLATSTLTFFYFLMGFVFGTPVWLALLLFLFLYQYGCMLILKRFTDLRLLNVRDRFLTIVFGVVIILFHSIPAYYSLWQLFRHKTVNTKTERS